MIYDKSINVNRLKDMKLILMRTPNEKLGFIKHEWIENIFISLCSWFAVVFIGIAFYVAIYHKDVFEKITGRKI